MMDKRISHHEIFQRLGEGGVVYMAQDGKPTGNRRTEIQSLNLFGF